MRNSDTLLVGWDHSHGDIPILIVGRKAPGQEAEELYKRLVTKDGPDKAG